MRLLRTKIAAADAGQAASGDRSRTVRATGRPPRSIAKATAANAAAMISHASYRVHAAANNATPSFVGTTPDAPASTPSTHSYSQSRTTKTVASINGSVIGVLCRYSRFGFTTNSAAVVAAPAIEPVIARTRRAAAHVVSVNERIETSDATIPVR